VGPLKLVHEKYKGKDDWLRKEFLADFEIAIQANKVCAARHTQPRGDASARLGFGISMLFLRAWLFTCAMPLVTVSVHSPHALNGRDACGHLRQATDTE